MGEEVTITYETLYELYRREKDRAELQELPTSFFADVAGYLSEKEAAVHPARGSIFDNETQRARIQVENIKKILMALYDRRETKIINMAMVKARTQGIINLQPLLDQEKDLYNSVVGILNMYRGGVLQSLMMGDSVRAPQYNAPAPSPFSTRAPNAALSFAPPPQHPSSQREDVPQDLAPPSGSLSPQSTGQPASLQRTYPNFSGGQERSAMLPSSDADGDLAPKESKTVRFLCAVPKFVGPNLEVYGPFSENDTATLPEPIVNVLLSKSRIEMCDAPPTIPHLLDEKTTKTFINPP